MEMIGIIGGSGLENPEILKNAREIKLKTPFGKHSPITVGEISGKKIALLSRHGKKHELSPSNVNYRANIWALRKLGCKHVLASSACGSLREEIKPGDFVLPNQFIDRTFKRQNTFFDKEGKVVHLPMAEPFCPKLRKLIFDEAKKLGYKIHLDKTVITIEGPRFSTKAESKLFRSWNADVINMTTIPEAVLAREAGLCYQVIAMSTDYDCFLEDKPAVTIAEVLKVMKENSDKVKELFLAIIPKIKHEDCDCMHAAENANI